MSDSKKDPQEEQMLDALLVWALQGETLDDFAKSIDESDVSWLTDEDRRALDELGPDLIQRIMTDTWEHIGSSCARDSRNAGELRTAMNRSGDDSMTEKAREEIRRRIRRAQEQAE